MNEYMEINLRRNDKLLRVKRQVPGGVELDEPDPIERSVFIGFDAADDITAYRLRRVRQLQGWDPFEFKLVVAVEDGAIVLRGVDAFSLPEGRYTLAVSLEEAKTSPARQRVTVPYDGFGAIDVSVEIDDRGIEVDLTDCDPTIAGVLDRSVIDGENAVDWLDDEIWRPSRKACLLNVLASLRVRPTLNGNLAQYVRDVFWMENGRAYATVDRELFDTLEDLSDDNQKPFYREGYPQADIHLKLLEKIPEPPERRPLFPRDSLVSFRGEGGPSLQAVVARPPAGLDYTYADLDLDLGNPLQDLAGFVVHMGELVTGKPTNHLDLRKALAKGSAKPFLYYTID
jgi:hypothetical protein